MKITSSEFTHQGGIPKKYTCDGDDTNPPLRFEDVPDDASSLVLIVDDPDAPAGDWVHWVLYDIPPSVDVIEEDSVPQGALEGETSFGSEGYGGPCPPDGKHRYFFKLYALDIDALTLPEGTTKDRIEEAMQNHILDTAELIGTYSRA